jgi:predicted ATPase/DNA-binding NarL/FixJ family response regulator
MARPARRLGNLPAEPSSFVGRRRELAELRKKLTAVRLVSLVGPGGVGKTRLAMRLASDVARGFSGGVWLVELAEVRDSALVANAAIAALDLRDQSATEPLTLLLSYLKDKDLLLVVDNCEHLLGAAARLVSEALRAAPGVRVIATSREPLTVAGEHVVPVPPLELPSAHAAEPLGQLRQNEAVMLFAERAAAASGRFEVTAANRAAVADLCRRLDGLPLAIELAAVRTRILTVEQILDRLTDRFSFLSGGGRGAIPRHQTLGTTIDWSYDLLSAEERTLLRRLSVFAGRFTLEDADGVCTSDDVPAVHGLDLMSSLVDRSLVIREDAKKLASFRLHETMREYAGDKARQAREVELNEERFAEYYWLRCQRAAPEARYHLVEWLEWMDLEIDNIRWVLLRCVNRGEFERGIELATSLRYFWITRATTEGVHWLDQVLASGRGSAEALVRAFYVRGLLAALQADPAAAVPALDRSVAAAREIREGALLSPSLSMRSIAEYMTGDSASAREWLEEARVVTARLDDFLARITFLQARALGGLIEGDLEAVRSAASEGVSLSREKGDLYSLEMMLMNLGGAALTAGDTDNAKPLYEEGLRVARQIDDRVTQFHFVDALGYIAASSGQARLAAQLLGAAETMRTEVGANVTALNIPRLAKVRESGTASLGPLKFEAEFETGKRLRRNAAVRLALGESAEVAGTSSNGAREGLLGKREADVARLVADGLSNKQIGARLFISERTVDSHVRSILNKLGFNSRAQIAAWTASSNR